MGARAPPRVWFNSRNLGHYWKAGSSQSIFLRPGCWMKRDAENEIVVLELESENCPAMVATITKAVWGGWALKRCGVRRGAKGRRLVWRIVGFSPETILRQSA